MEEEPGRLQSMGLLRVGHDWATSLSLSHIGEGNGNPLQYSCLENPRDGRAWCTAVCGVTQSRTRLKRLSSSSICRFMVKLTRIGVISTKPLLNLKSWRFTSVFSSKCFIVLDFTFSSLINFKRIFIYGVRQASISLASCRWELGSQLSYSPRIFSFVPMERKYPWSFFFFFFTAGIQAGGGAQGLASGNIYICFGEFQWVFSCADRILVAAGECGHTACTLRDGLYSVKAAFPQKMRALLGEGSNYQRSLGSLCVHALKVCSNCSSMCKKYLQGRDKCAELCVLVLIYEDLSLPQKKTNAERVYRTLSSFLFLRWYSTVKWSESCSVVSDSL